MSSIGEPAQTALMQTARRLETRFVAEMLDQAGLDAREGGFGGGAGESQFASMMVTEKARAIVDSGGLGLSEAIYESLLTSGAPEGDSDG